MFKSFNTQDRKVDRLNNVVCVIDYVSKAGPDLRFIELNTTILDDQVKSFNRNMEARFITYGRVVSYQGTYEDFGRDLSMNGISPVKTKAKQFFNPEIERREAELKPPPVNVSQQRISQVGVSAASDLATLKYQIETVKTPLSEYESLLKQVDDFYASYITILNRNAEEASKVTACANGPLAQTKASLLSVSEEAKRERDNFNKNFNVKLLSPNKRILYGIQ